MNPQTELCTAIQHHNQGEEDRINREACGDLFAKKPVKLTPQHHAILDYLKTGKSLTPLEALRIAGTFKLSSRISELKGMGYRFNQEYIKTESGKKVMRYWL